MDSSQQLSSIPVSHPPGPSFKSKFFGSYLDNSQTSIQSDTSFSFSYQQHNHEPQAGREQAIALLLATHRRMIVKSAVGQWLRAKEVIKRRTKRTPQYLAKLLMKMSMMVNVKVRTRCFAFFELAKMLLEKHKEKQEKLRKQLEIEREREKEKGKEEEKKKVASLFIQPLPESKEPPPVMSIIRYIAPPLKLDIEKDETPVVETVVKSSRQFSIKKKESQVKKEEQVQAPSLKSVKSAPLLPQLQSKPEPEKKQQKQKKKSIPAPTPKQLLARLNSVSQGVVKLYKFQHNFQAKHFNDAHLLHFLHLLSKNYHQAKAVPLIFKLLDGVKAETSEMVWEHLKKWVKYVDKIDIFRGTVGLSVHDRLRFAMLNIQLHARRKQREDKNINSASIENQGQKQGVGLSQQSRKEQNKIFKKKSSVAECQTSLQTSTKNINILPESSSVKETEQLLTQNIQNYKSTNHTIISRNVEELSVSKPEISQHSVSSTIKPCKPICFLGIKTKEISVGLEGDLHLTMNNLERQFSNANHSMRGFPLRSDQVRKDLTDFNDLFFARQVHNFYLSFEPRPSPSSSRPVASSHVIKEEYSSFLYETAPKNDQPASKNDQHQNKSIMPLSFAGSLKRIDRQKSIRSKNSRKSSQTKIEQNIYISPLTFNSRRKMKIPTELPKNFDYYADKSLSKHSHKKSVTRSDHSSLNDINRGQSQPQLYKKMFREVKGSRSTRKMLTSPLNALRVPEEGHSKVSKGSRTSRRERSNRSNKKQQKGQAREGKSPERGEYQFAFSRQPPKKKGRKEQ